MGDIGSLDSGDPEDGGQSSLRSLLNSLASETGHTLPSLPRRPSAAPLTEEELLNLPFYSVATQEPEVELNLANYRTLLIELLVKIRIKSPASLHNKTIGEMFAAMDWERRGPDINSMLLDGEHNSLCLGHGRKPLIPYQSFSPPQYKHLDRRRDTCPGFRTHPYPPS